MTTTTHMGRRIRRRREALHLSRSALAARITERGYKVRDQQIYRWEHFGAIPKGSAIACLELALEVAPGWLGHGSVADRAIPTQPLSPAKLIALIGRLALTTAEQDALQRHLEGTEASEEVVTDSYVVGFVRGLRASGSPREAFAAAVNEQALRDMQGEGRHVLTRPLPSARGRKTRARVAAPSPGKLGRRKKKPG